MEPREEASRRVAEPPRTANYPLKETTSYLNERLGLYLSEEQQRGFATGLLIGTALGAGLLVWNLLTVLRRNV